MSDLEAGTVASEDADDFWALHGLEQRVDPRDEGTVLFTGVVRPAPGERYVWQQGVPAGSGFDHPERAASVLSALGHPVRLALLQAALAGHRSTGVLAETPGLATTGQLHHHLRILVAAGWLETAIRGHYSVPATRVVPLLVVLAAAAGAPAPVGADNREADPGDGHVPEAGPRENRPGLIGNHENRPGANRPGGPGPGSDATAEERLG
ncbi:helix-turn-helix domain-containing protein [Nakamurella alba]|uniref:helix-turn-helix domain-containing protein n=1 Tax=Nakamurella alba TaxID=2665158 RepID=UPI002AC32887|nr:helix-turn-helix domain-containing protein [Nakamurella alba]